MDDTSGFYKWDDGQLLYAPNAVLMAGNDLYREQKDDYTYPVNGWTWYDSIDQVPPDITVVP